MARTKQTARKLQGQEQPPPKVNEAFQRRKEEQRFRKETESQMKQRDIIDNSIKAGNFLLYPSLTIPVFKRITKSNTQALYVIDSRGTPIRINKETMFGLPSGVKKELENRRWEKFMTQNDSYYQGNQFDSFQTAVARTVYWIMADTSPENMEGNQLPGVFCDYIMMECWDWTKYCSGWGKVVDQGDKLKKHRAKNYDPDTVMQTISAQKRVLQTPFSFSHHVMILFSGSYHLDPYFWFYTTPLVSFGSIMAACLNPDHRTHLLHCMHRNAVQTRSMFLALHFFQIFLVLSGPFNLFAHYEGRQIPSEALPDAGGDTADAAYGLQSTRIPSSETQLVAYNKWALMIRKDGWIHALAQFVGPTEFWKTYLLDCDFFLPAKPKALLPPST